ncbi:MAG TPA: hypothetical protein V6D33_18780 [Cyanophyceae cyanobacterium]
MEYQSTLSIPEAIQLAKATANTLTSPPRLYDGDSSSVHLWTDNPGRVKQWRYGESLGGAYTPYRNIDFFILTLKVEPSIIELPISWDKKIKGWLMREKPRPETHFEGYYIIFSHNYWIELLHKHDFWGSIKLDNQGNWSEDINYNFEIFSQREYQDEHKDKAIEQRIQKIVEQLEQLNDASIEELYKSEKDSLEKELKSRRESRERLAHSWRFHVKPDRSVNFLGETGLNLPTNPSLSWPKP